MAAPLQFLAARQWGRSLLLRFPKLFTRGLFSHEGPSQEQARQTALLTTIFLLDNSHAVRHPPGADPPRQRLWSMLQMDATSFTFTNIARGYSNGKLARAACVPAGRCSCFVGAPLWRHDAGALPRLTCCPFQTTFGHLRARVHAARSCLQARPRCPASHPTSRL